MFYCYQSKQHIQNFRDNTVIIFLTVICFCAFVYVIYLFSLINIALTEHQKKIDKDFEVITKYLLKVALDESMDRLFMHVFGALDSHVLIKEQIMVRIKDSEDKIIQALEDERKKIEDYKAERSKNSFKSLKMALSSKGTILDED